MEALLKPLIANVLGSWVTTAIGSAAIWTSVSQVSADFAAGKSIVDVLVTPEFHTLALGVGALFVKDPHK